MKDVVIPFNEFIHIIQALVKAEFRVYAIKLVQNYLCFSTFIDAKDFVDNLKKI